MKKMERMSQLPVKLITPDLTSDLDKTLLADDKYSLSVGGDFRDSIQMAKMVRSLISSRTSVDKFDYVMSTIQFNDRLLAYAETLDTKDQMVFRNIVAKNLEELLMTKVNGVNYDDLDIIADALSKLYDRLEDCDKSWNSGSGLNIEILDRVCQSDFQLRANELYAMVVDCESTDFYPLHTTHVDSVKVVFDEECVFTEQDGPVVFLVRTFPNNDATFNSISLDDVQNIELVTELRRNMMGALPIVYGNRDTLIFNERVGIEKELAQRGFGSGKFIYRNGMMQCSGYGKDNQGPFWIECLLHPYAFSLSTRAYSEFKFDMSSKFNMSGFDTRGFTMVKSYLDSVNDAEVVYRTPTEIGYRGVTNFIKDVVSDPTVESIWMTLYRIGSDSNRIIKSLIEAAKAGKKVRVYIELTASGDELRNLSVFQMLSTLPNVKLYSGFIGMKVHAKMFLARGRNMDGTTRWYIHTSTGNYNEQTGTTYFDMQYFANNSAIAWELHELFSSLVKKEIVCVSGGKSYRSLVLPIHGKSSVNRVKSTIMRLISRVIADHDANGTVGGINDKYRIIFKCNHLLDSEIEDALQKAAERGIRVDLIIRTTVRGAMKSIPNVFIHHPVGKYLEHDRIYAAIINGVSEVYISSADLMYRNLYNRAETIMKVRNANSKGDITHMLKKYCEVDEMGGQRIYHEAGKAEE